jgi:transcription antitermination factor NusG
MGTATDLDSWLLVRTQPQREQYAQHNILRWLGLESYLPFYYEREKDKVKPLFPSYLFVRSFQWYAFKGVWGVSNVVMVGETPARLCNDQILELREREKYDEQRRHEIIELPDPYKIGDTLRIKDGAFFGFNGLYDGMDSKDRVYILLKIFGRENRVPLPREAVEPI